MDYSTKVIEDGVVDSPPSCSHVLHVVSSSLPLKVKIRATARIQSSVANSRSFRKLYDSLSSSIPKVLVKECSIFTFVYKIGIICKVYANTLLDCLCIL
jgi:hypothetical protein